MTPRFSDWMASLKIFNMKMFSLTLALLSALLLFLPSAYAQEEEFVATEVFVVNGSESGINAAAASNGACSVSAELAWYRKKFVKVNYYWERCSGSHSVRWELDSIRQVNGRFSLSSSAGKHEAYPKTEWPELQSGDKLLLRTWINDVRQADIVTEYRNASPVWPQIHSRSSADQACFMFSGHVDPWGVFTAGDKRYVFHLNQTDWQTPWIAGPSQPKVDWHVQFYEDAGLSKLRAEYWFNGVENPCYQPQANVAVTITCEGARITGEVNQPMLLEYKLSDRTTKTEQVGPGAFNKTIAWQPTIAGRHGPHTLAAEAKLWHNSTMLASDQASGELTCGPPTGQVTVQYDCNGATISGEAAVPMTLEYKLNSDQSQSEQVAAGVFSKTISWQPSVAGRYGPHKLAVEANLKHNGALIDSDRAYGEIPCGPPQGEVSVQYDCNGATLSGKAETAMMLEYRLSDGQTATLQVGPGSFAKTMKWQPAIQGVYGPHNVSAEAQLKFEGKLLASDAANGELVCGPKPDGNVVVEVSCLGTNISGEVNTAMTLEYTLSDGRTGTEPIAIGRFHKTIAWLPETLNQPAPHIESANAALKLNGAVINTANASAELLCTEPEGRVTVQATCKEATITGQANREMTLEYQLNNGATVTEQVGPGAFSKTLAWQPTIEGLYGPHLVAVDASLIHNGEQIAKDNVSTSLSCGLPKGDVAVEVTCYGATFSGEASEPMELVYALNNGTSVTEQIERGPFSKTVAWQPQIEGKYGPHPISAQASLHFKGIQIDTAEATQIVTCLQPLGNVSVDVDCQEARLSGSANVTMTLEYSMYDSTTNETRVDAMLVGPGQFDKKIAWQPAINTLFGSNIVTVTAGLWFAGAQYDSALVSKSLGCRPEPDPDEVKVFLDCTGVIFSGKVKEPVTLEYRLNGAASISEQVGPGEFSKTVIWDNGNRRPFGRQELTAHAQIKRDGKVLAEHGGTIPCDMQAGTASCQLLASHYGDPIGKSHITAWINEDKQVVAPIERIVIDWNQKGTVNYPTRQQAGPWLTNRPFELVSEPDVPDVGFGRYQYYAWVYVQGITNPAYCTGVGEAPDHDNLVPDPGPFAQDNPEGKFNRGNTPSRLPLVPRIPFDGGNGPEKIELRLWAFEKTGSGTSAKITGIANGGKPLTQIGMSSVSNFVKFDGVPAREGIVYGLQIGEHGPWSPLFCPKADANPSDIMVYWGAGGQTWLSDYAAYGDCWWLTVAAANNGWVTVDESVATYNARQSLVNWNGHINLVFSLAQSKETGLGPRMQDVVIGLQAKEWQGPVIPSNVPEDFWQVVEE